MGHLSAISALIAVLALTAACSRYEDHRAASEVKDAGQSVDNAAAKVAHDADVKRAEAAIKHAAHEAEIDARKAGAEAKAAAHKLAADTRDAAHGVTKQDRDDDRS